MITPRIFDSLNAATILRIEKATSTPKEKVDNYKILNDHLLNKNVQKPFSSNRHLGNE